MTAYDPDAVLPRTLALRLHGDGLNDGRLPDDALTDVLVQFRRELTAAAAAASRSEPSTLRLALVGTSGAAPCCISRRRPTPTSRPGTSRTRRR